MAISNTLSNMKQSIELLLRELEERHISKHILCPSVKTIMPNITNIVKDSIEIIDERSAGYVATGMCAEIDEPVVLWCADNESYRNLSSALTEAYYRKLPILVVALVCNSQINQAMNPYDTIRYYVNNSVIGSRGTLADIKTAIMYLEEEVKGPVYLSIGLYTPDLISKKSNTVNKSKINVANIIKILPSKACVHIGSGYFSDIVDKRNMICRTDRPTKDGNLSMFIGSSIIERNQLHVGFFTIEEIVYDLNMLGNRHIGNNLVVLCLIQDASSDTIIYDYARGMAWECKRISISDFVSYKMELVISDKPQYIEIVL